MAPAAQASVLYEEFLHYEYGQRSPFTKCEDKEKHEFVSWEQIHFYSDLSQSRFATVRRISSIQEN
jgi:hypothetical protein